MTQIHPLKTISKKTSIDWQSLLGKGAAGDVYNGLMSIGPTKEIEVAIKTIRLKTINNQVTSYLLQCQLQALKCLSKQPNRYIVKLHEIVVLDSVCYIVMQKLCGGTLRDFLNSQSQCSEQKCFDIMTKVIEGYSAINKHKIIHRDIKPQNIMFRKSDLKEPCIIDFGYCIFPNVRNIPQGYYNVGSPRYMAPQAYKSSLYSQKSDIWSLGIMIYEMMAGKTLDEGQNISDFHQKISKNGVNYPKQFPNYWKVFLNWILTFNPQKRIASNDLIKEIKSLKAFTEHKRQTNNQTIYQKNNNQHNKNNLQFIKSVNQAINHKINIVRKTVQGTTSIRFQSQPKDIRTLNQTLINNNNLQINLQNLNNSKTPNPQNQKDKVNQFYRPFKTNRPIQSLTRNIQSNHQNQTKLINNRNNIQSTQKTFISGEIKNTEKNIDQQIINAKSYQSKRINAYPQLNGFTFLRHTLNQTETQEGQLNQKELKIIDEMAQKKFNITYPFFPKSQKIQEETVLKQNQEKKVLQQLVRTPSHQNFSNIFINDAKAMFHSFAGQKEIKVNFNNVPQIKHERMGSSSPNNLKQLPFRYKSVQKLKIMPTLQGKIANIKNEFSFRNQTIPQNKKIHNLISTTPQNNLKNSQPVIFVSNRGRKI